MTREIELVFLDQRTELAWLGGRRGLADASAPLHIAPLHWLWLEPEAAALEGAREAGAHVVDVEGKWTCFSYSGAAARGALAAAIDADTVLEARGCAALAIFDCPAVLAKARGDGFLICVQSSYAASFTAAWSTALAAVARIEPGARMRDNDGAADPGGKA